MCNILHTLTLAFEVIPTSRPCKKLTYTSYARLDTIVQRLKHDNMK